MAVISELIDAGLTLKEQGNHQAAIEHFRQLHKTYPDHPRIMFELAGSWQSFGVPEQSLPLYQRLMALPKSQGLPPKEMPRLYTQLGACLRLLGQYTESLEVIEEGLQLYPDYRPLRAYRMFGLHSAGYHQNAMLDALDLMLESLAPTKWDLYENEIIDIVQNIRDRVPEYDTDNLEEWVFDEYWEDGADTSSDESDKQENDDDDVSVDDILSEAEAITNGDVLPEDTPANTTDDNVVASGKIEIEADAEDDDSFEVEVKVVKPKATQKKKPTKPSKQLGKKPVKIDIKDDDTVESDAIEDNNNTDDDNPKTPPSGKINIPVDFD